MKFRDGPGPDSEGGKADNGLLPSMESVVGETHGRATGGGFDATAFHESWLLRAIRFTVVLTFAHAVMAKRTETQDSYMSAVDKGFPLTNWLDPHNGLVGVDVATSITQT